MIQIPAACVEFNEGGNTIWVHSSIGATILRIKTMGKITVNSECENICSHSDMIVQDNIQICLSDDAKPITDFERLKHTFDQIGVPYVVEISEGGYFKLYTCSEEEQVAGKLNPRVMFKQTVLFEFYPDGSKASTP